MDSGASHDWGYIISEDYNPCHDNITVHIADGLRSKVAGTSSVFISKEIKLNLVLVIPNLDCNLVSVSRNKDKDAMMWHYLFGDSNLLYLKKLILCLFNKSPENFQYEVCQ